MKPSQYQNLDLWEGSGYSRRLTDNLSDGNCFYSAIYRSLRSRELFNIIECLNQNGLEIRRDTEKEFIEDIRQLVAKQIENGAVLTIYENYKALYESTNTDDIETLKIQLENADTNVEEKILEKINEKEKEPSTPFFTEEEFNSIVVESITTNGNWASEFDTRILRSLFKSCNITIDLYSELRKAPQYLPKEVDGMNYIYLYNSGGSHYKHYVLGENPFHTRLLRDTRADIIDSVWRPLPKSGGTRKNRIMHLKNRNTRRASR